MLMREQIDELKKENDALRRLLVQCYRKTNDPAFEQELRTIIEKQMLRNWTI